MKLDAPIVPPLHSPPTDRVLRLAPAWGAIWLVAAACACAWWTLAPDADAGLVVTLLLMGAAWWLIEAGSRDAQRPGLAAITTGVAIGLVGLRLLQVATPADFWIARAAPPLVLPATALALGGPRCLVRAFPGWLALTLWLWWPPMDWILAFDSRGGVSAFTAQVTGFLLSLLGHQIRVEANAIWLGKIEVDVLMPCTCLPLIQALAQTLAPGAILVRLSWIRSLALAALVVPVAFAISVVRCAILVLVAPEPERFHWWHGPEGAGLFTAVALVLLGGALVAGARAPGWRIAPVRPPLGDPARRAAVAALALGAVFAWWRQPPEASALPPPRRAPPPAWTVTAREDRVWTPESARTDKPLTQGATWTLATPEGEARLTIAIAPTVLGVDPAALLYFHGFDARAPSEGTTETLPGLVTPVEGWVGAGGRWSVALVGSDGAARTGTAAWTRWLHAQRWQPKRWVALLAGRAALIDKRAVWVAVRWPPRQTGEATPDQSVAKLIASGLDSAQAMFHDARP